MAVVEQVTSFTRSGLSDYVVQRVTAVVLTLYTFCIVGFIAVTPDLTHGVWREFLGQFSMQVFSSMAILATVGHAWVGMWTVGTDYIRPHYFGTVATPARFLYQSACVVALFVYVAWALQIIWSI
jgi:succinate dehydrogenase / fumarate reductase membrane anchor subunit